MGRGGVKQGRSGGSSGWSSGGGWGEGGRSSFSEWGSGKGSSWSGGWDHGGGAKKRKNGGRDKNEYPDLSTALQMHGQDCVVGVVGQQLDKILGGAVNSVIGAFNGANGVAVAGVTVRTTGPACRCGT